MGFFKDPWGIQFWVNRESQSIHSWLQARWIAYCRSRRSSQWVGLGHPEEMCISRCAASRGSSMRRQSSERRSAMAAQCFRRPTVPASHGFVLHQRFASAIAGRNRKLQPTGWNNGSFRIRSLRPEGQQPELKFRRAAFSGNSPVLENMDRKIEKRKRSYCLKGFWATPITLDYIQSSLAQTDNISAIFRKHSHIWL